jgi:hypothetical protein
MQLLSYDMPENLTPRTPEDELFNVIHSPGFREYLQSYIMNRPYRGEVRTVTHVDQSQGLITLSKGSREPEQTNIAWREYDQYTLPIKLVESCALLLDQDPSQIEDNELFHQLAGESPKDRPVVIGTTSGNYVPRSSLVQGSRLRFDGLTLTDFIAKVKQMGKWYQDTPIKGEERVVETTLPSSFRYGLNARVVFAGGKRTDVPERVADYGRYVLSVDDLVRTARLVD